MEETTTTTTATPPPAEVVVELSNCKHPIVRQCVLDLGWKVAEKDSQDYHVFWTDLSVSTERVAQIGHQRKLINHFPSMDLIARKIPLAANLSRMKKQFPSDFDFFPRAFLDHASLLEFQQSQVALARAPPPRLPNPNGGVAPIPTIPGATATTSATNTTTTSSSSSSSSSSAGVPSKSARRKSVGEKPFFIVKPNNGCMGKGIYLTSNPTAKDFENNVIQEYVADPMLIEGRKFDLRCYVLATSVAPLRVYFCRQGLVRLCAEPYERPTQANVGESCKHITNYAVNKRSSLFEVNAATYDGCHGHKRDFDFLSDHLAQQGYDVSQVWAGVHDLVIKTFLSILRMLCQAYHSCVGYHSSDADFLGSAARSRSGLKPGSAPQQPLRSRQPQASSSTSCCFELLGFDVLLDRRGKAWLMEVNHSPSLATDTPLDYQIKHAVITEVLQLCCSSRGRSRKASSNPKNPDVGSGGSGGKKKRVSTAARLKAFEEVTLRQFVRVYPCATVEQTRSYDRFMSTPAPTPIIPTTAPPAATSATSQRKKPPRAHSLPKNPAKADTAANTTAAEPPKTARGKVSSMEPTTTQSHLESAAPKSLVRILSDVRGSLEDCSAVVKQSLLQHIVQQAPPLQPPKRGYPQRRAATNPTTMTGPPFYV